MGKKTVRIDDSSTTQKILQQSAHSRMWDHGLFVPTTTLPQPVAPFDLITVEFASVTKATARQVLADTLAPANAMCPPLGSGDGDAD